MRTAIHRVLAALAICAAALAAFAGTPESPLARDEVSAVQLAEWIRARQPALVVLDARPPDAVERDGLPGARPLAGFVGEAGQTVVLYGERSTDDVLPPNGNPERVLRLRGGIEAWNEDVLFPVMRSDASEEQRAQFTARAGLSRYFGGSPRVLDPGAAARRLRSRRGC